MHLRATLPREASLAAAQRTRDDAGSDAVKRTEHLMLTHPHHVPAELAERAVARGIMPCALLVVRPVNLDDEPHLGACEVDDVLPDREELIVLAVWGAPKQHGPKV